MVNRLEAEGLTADDLAGLPLRVDGVMPLLTPFGEPQGPNPPVYHHPLFDYQIGARVVMVAGESRKLEPLLRTLLTVFVQHPNQTVEHRELEDRLVCDRKNLRTHIARLKNAIGSRGVIENVKSVGYRFIDDTKDRAKSEPVFHHSKFDYYPERRLIKSGEKSAHLSPMEHVILSKLFVGRNHPVHYTRMVDSVWEQLDKDLEHNTLAVHINRLRKKLTIVTSDPKLICTRNGEGYMLIDTPEVPAPVRLNGTVSIADLSRSPQHRF